MNYDPQKMMETPLADIFEVPMRSGLYGTVQLDRFPFRIMLNSKVLAPRKMASLIHEMLHIWMRLHKMDDFPHDKLHDLALFIQAEVLPTMMKYEALPKKEASNGTSRPDGRSGSAAIR